MPILTVNNDPTRPMTMTDARRLKEECDDVTTYAEAGWFCVAGWKEGKRLVHAHCGSRREYDRMMGNGPSPEEMHAAYVGRR